MKLEGWYMFSPASFARVLVLILFQRLCTGPSSLPSTSPLYPSQVWDMATTTRKHLQGGLSSLFGRSLVLAA